MANPFIKTKDGFRSLSSLIGLSDVSDDVTGAQSDITTLQSSVTALQSSVTTLQSDVTALQAAEPWIVVEKTSNEARNNAGTGTTLTADATLVFSVSASTKYRFRMSIWYTTSATPDFKFDLNGPASPTVIQYIYEYDSNADDNDEFPRNAYNVSTSIASTGQTFGIVRIDGILQNGSNAGTFQFRWAQDTSSASNTTVLAGSYIEYSVI